MQLAISASLDMTMYAYMIQGCLNARSWDTEQKRVPFAEEACHKTAYIATTPVTSEDDVCID